MKPTDWLPLFDGASLAKWGIDVPDHLEIDGDALVVHPDAKGEGVRAEVGGASWDNYILSADVMITRQGDDAHYCVQLTADGTAIYCQLVPGAVLLAYYCDEPKDDPKGFTHLAKKQVDIPEGTWFNFQMKAQEGVVTAIVDGTELLSAKCPRRTDRGFPGFLINQQKQSEVRIRNIAVKFLDPTDEQLQEYEKDAGYNWLRHKEKQKLQDKT